MKPQLRDFLQIASIRHITCSPDGAHVAFVSDQSGIAQLYRVSIDANIEPIVLTGYTEPVQFAAYSPTREQIAFGLARGGDERMQIFVYDVATAEVSQLTNQAHVIHRWGGWSPDGTEITYSSNERNGVDFDVYVLNILTQESRCIFAQGGWCDSLGFSSAGRYVFVRVQYTFHRHDAYLVDVHNGDTVQHLTPHEGTAEYENPSWLPNDSGVVFTSSTNREYTAVELYDCVTTQRRTVYAPESDVLCVAVHPTKPIVACVVNSAGYPRLQLRNLTTGEQIVYASLPQHLVREIIWATTGDRIICITEDTTEPTNILVWSMDDDRGWFLSHNTATIPASRYVEPTLEQAVSFDGLKIPFFLFTPKTPLPHKPAIVLVHGGPESQFQAGFHPLVQYFVMLGYAVAAPNVRGSSGYGKTFLALDDREKRMDSVHDLESIHQWLVRSGVAHHKNIAVMGGSYGGYMTLAGLAFQPHLWAAGVDTVGMSNLVTFLQHTASWRRQLREDEYGSLEADRELLTALSPMNAIDRIVAPLLVIHGANDPRVPLAEAEQIVHALKKRERIAELLVYPDEGHGLHKLHNRIDAYTRVADFFDRYLCNT